MERKTRFELATSSLARRHSTTELLPRMVPRPRIELGTRRFSVYQQGLSVEILQHLASIGQIAEQLLRSIQLDNSVNGTETNDSIKILERMLRGERDDD
jgi:hypothetical protein